MSTHSKRFNPPTCELKIGLKSAEKTEHVRSPVARMVFLMAKSHRKRSIAVHIGKQEMLISNDLCQKNGALPFISIPSDTKRVYYVLSIILYLLQTVNPNNTFAIRFKELLSKYPSVDVAAMGFPNDWQSQDLWC